MGEPDVVAPGEGPDGGKTSINSEAQDSGKTLVNGKADQVCHNVSVTLFTSKDYLAGLATQYDEIIDVRTPLEFEEDHILGAVNLPVLSNEQRVQVGSLYHKDRIAGRKLGAALITANISKVMWMKKMIQNQRLKFLSTAQRII